MRSRCPSALRRNYRLVEEEGGQAGQDGREHACGHASGVNDVDTLVTSVPWSKSPDLVQEIAEHKTQDLVAQNAALQQKGVRIIAWQDEVVQDDPVYLALVGHPLSCGAGPQEMIRYGDCSLQAACQRCHICAQEAPVQPSWLPEGDNYTKESQRVGVSCLAPAIQVVFEACMVTKISHAMESRETSVPNPALAWCNTSRSGQLIPNRGTVGHPTECGPFCKYARRKGGCRDGANCPNCHYCFKYEKAKPVEDVPAVSRGSENHPFACRPPCKFARRQAGCHLGARCTECHLCFWSKVPTAKTGGSGTARTSGRKTRGSRECLSLAFALQ